MGGDIGGGSCRDGGGGGCVGAGVGDGEGDGGGEGGGKGDSVQGNGAGGCDGSDAGGESGDEGGGESGRKPKGVRFQMGPKPILWLVLSPIERSSLAQVPPSSTPVPISKHTAPVHVVMLVTNSLLARCFEVSISAS